MEWLKTQPFAAQIRVIVLSGSEHNKDRDRAAELGAADYLVKPIRVIDFHRTLGALCQLSSEIGASV